MTQASKKIIINPNSTTGVKEYTVNGTHYADFTVGLVRSGYSVDAARQATANWAADVDATVFEAKYKANYALAVAPKTTQHKGNQWDVNLFSRFNRYELLDTITDDDKKKTERYIVAYKTSFSGYDPKQATPIDLTKPNNNEYKYRLFAGIPELNRGEMRRYDGFNQLAEFQVFEAIGGTGGYVYYNANNIFNGIYSEGMPAKNATNTVKGYNSTFTVTKEKKKIAITHKGPGDTYYGPGPDGVKGTEDDVYTSGGTYYGPGSDGQRGTEDDVYTSKVTVYDAVFGNQNNGGMSSVLADGTPVSVGERPYDAGTLTGLNKEGWKAIGDGSETYDSLLIKHKWTSEFRVKANPSVYTLYNYGKDVGFTNTPLIGNRYAAFKAGVSNNSLTFELGENPINTLGAFSGGAYVQHSLALTFNIREFRYSNLKIVLI